MAYRSLALGLVLASAGLTVVAVARLEPAQAAPSAASHHNVASEPHWRMPTALWLAPDGATLFAACKGSGAISVIDTASLQPVAEVPVGQSLVAMSVTPDGRTMALCDAAADELVMVDRDGRALELRARLPLPARPVSVTIDRQGRTASVASSWSRQVSRVDLATGKVTAAVQLDFSPRSSIFLADDRTLVVADAFGGKLALLDGDRVVRQIEVPGHNIRGLALSSDGKELLVSHMILTESAATTRDNVFWGITMSSIMRVIPVSALLDLDKNPIREAHTYFFGEPGHAAGDPEALATASDGTALLCLAGVGEVAVGRYYPFDFRRILVGERPVALAIAPDEQLAYVANAHSDSISVINIPGRASVAGISLGPVPPLDPAQEGERLFYDARLSLDGWFSCHSCHTDGHANGQNADTFGDGSYGAAKNVLSLLGTRGTDPWGWNGSKRTLDDQVRESLRLTMQPKSSPSERAVAALAAYLRTLEPPSIAEWQRSDRQAIERGEEVFAARGCATCHAPPTYTSPQVFDVGLDDGEGGNRQFNPPSLRGLAHSAPYLHDGRAKKLEAVFREFRHKISGELSDGELNDLVAFLRSL